ncbi:3-oxoacyl-[acyl-carrier-protein] reductase FabG [Tolypocladium ophioglossoides CBS 100239]|uniref:3-oxoacyl-[acyl-carrier-protein] reductase FabG n=1 Tax=Tolypocladium ophioglossoides (strain CBS 100239) TaxID=1163406 RepID=A0A0L0N504_TOLOC|nr:3-oxoacyl-[acyl-carrier-protein] reductase FabG [Tolypocladium ophioglossoides CBS 100239]
MGLSGQAFVVTGGASGIGRATVQKLLQLSATVYVLDKSTAVTESAHNGRLFSYPGVDVSSRQDMVQIFDKISEQSPGLRGLVNCAGILAQSPTSAEGDESLKRLWSVNVLGTWIAATEFRRCLQKAPDRSSTDAPGSSISIVNIGSMASLMGMVGLSGYVASKHGVLGLSRCMAQEWGPEGIRVNCVAPGGVKTPMTQGLEGLDSPLFRAAYKQMAEPEEIADTILYLLSDKSSNISGQVIGSNGGWA